MRTLFTSSLISVALAGCGGEPSNALASDASTADTSTDTNDAASDTMDAGPGAGDAVVRDSGSSSDADAGGSTSVPTEGTALLAWLQARSYLSFPGESKVHTSAGPHGGGVRTYITKSLAASLDAKAKEHPEGAAMVKEFYGGGSSEVTGWAVAVKTAPVSSGGDNWYWYEIFGTTSATKPVADGKGLPGCKGCHSGGKDFVLSPYPLQ